MEIKINLILGDSKMETTPKLKYNLMKKAKTKRVDPTSSVILTLGSRYFQYGNSPNDEPEFQSDSCVVKYEKEGKQYYQLKGIILFLFFFL
jgi:hypothetical protein